MACEAMTGSGLHDAGSGAPNSPETAQAISLAEAIERVGALLQAARLDEASTLCHRILAARPDRADILFIAGQLAWRAGRQAEAFACLNRLIAVQPDLPAAYGMLGDFSRSSGRFDRAAAQYRRGLALDPALAAARQGLDLMRRSPPAPMPAIPAGPLPRQPRNGKTYLTPEYLEAARQLIARKSLPHGERALQFLIGNQDIFTNKAIFAFTHNAFGNIILQYDMLARMYYPQRVSFIVLPGRFHNDYLIRCFENIDSFVFDLTPAERSGSDVRLELRVTTRALLNLYAAFADPRDGDVEILSDNFVLTMPKTVWTVRGDEGVPVLPAVLNKSGYGRFLEGQVGRPPAMDAADLASCRERIAAAYPGFLDRPFVTFLLRHKGSPSWFSDHYRNAGPPENYLPAIRHFVDSGYSVVGTGETLHEAFRGIDGYYDLLAANLPPDLLNIFALSQCALFVGQQSGGYSLPNAVGVPCLITDSVPYFHGTHGPGDIVLNKSFRLPRQDRPLSLLDVFRDHPDLVGGVNFTVKGVEVVNNSAEQILDAAREALTLVERPESEPDDIQELAARFRAAIPPGVEMRGHPSRPPASVLHALRDELMRYPVLPELLRPRRQARAPDTKIQDAKIQDTRAQDTTPGSGADTPPDIATPTPTATPTPSATPSATATPAPHPDPEMPALTPASLLIAVMGYNRGDYLAVAVDSIERNAPGIPLVIVDDGSTDPATVALLERLGTRHRILISSTSPGRAHWRSLGGLGGLAENMNAVIELATREGFAAVFFIQDDQQLVRPLDAGFFEETTQVFRSDRAIAQVLPLFFRGLYTKAALRARYPIDRANGIYDIGFGIADTGILHLGRSNAKGFRFGTTENLSGQKARALGMRFVHVKNPVVMFMPWPATTRDHPDVVRQLNLGVHPFLDMGEEEVARLRANPIDVYPVAEEILKTREPLRRPWWYTMVTDATVLEYNEFCRRKQEAGEPW